MAGLGWAMFWKKNGNAVFVARPAPPPKVDMKFLSPAVSERRVTEFD